MNLPLLFQALMLLLLLLVVVLLLVRKPQSAPVDARMLQLPEQLTRLDARSESLVESLREGLAGLRRESSENAAQLRTEITGSIARLGDTLNGGLDKFRIDNAASSAALSANVHAQLEAISQQLIRSASDAHNSQLASREALNSKLSELNGNSAANLDKIRLSVEGSLTKLNMDNRSELEKMRQTVDEKLQLTLQTRLTESFGEVTRHLGDVQKGLGEMKEMATGVGDLKKVLSNVSRRGGVGEFLVGQQLEQMFSPEQYLKQANIKPHTSEAVDYALKFPNGETGNYVLLPIDSKFPTSDWERLQHAHDHGTPEDVAAAEKAFDRSIRTQAKSICEKYIDPPTTMPHAIMVLPTESLYAEVVRRPGLQADIQSNCRVTIAGPSTFMAILSSFQMGFHTLAIQKKGDEVWRVLSSTKNEFEKFGGLMDKVKKQVDTVQNTLGEIGGKTKTINRALKNVSNMETGAPVSNLLGFEEIASVAPLLAASVEED